MTDLLGYNDSYVERSKIPPNWCQGVYTKTPWYYENGSNGSWQTSSPKGINLMTTPFKSEERDQPFFYYCLHNLMTFYSFVYKSFLTYFFLGENYNFHTFASKLSFKNFNLSIETTFSFEIQIPSTILFSQSLNRSL